MTGANFKLRATQAVEHALEVLLNKGNEYNDPQDYFGYFNKAASFLGQSKQEALFGMLTKHLISLSDMCASDKEFPLAQWQEKTTDAINYLILLYVMMEEQYGQDKSKNS